MGAYGPNGSDDRPDYFGRIKNFWSRESWNVLRFLCYMFLLYLPSVAVERTFGKIIKWTTGIELKHYLYFKWE